LPFYRSGVPGSKLCPKFSEFSVDSEITGLSQSSLSIKAFVHPAAVMMVLTDSFAVFAADVDAAWYYVHEKY
jgi:hypothetical protein